MRRLGDIHSLLVGDVQRAKSELAKHCTEITLTLEGQTYHISGDWNLGRSDGAGGPDRNSRVCRFSLPFEIAMTIPHEPSGFWKDVGSALSKIVEVFTKPLAVVHQTGTSRMKKVTKFRDHLSKSA